MTLRVPVSPIGGGRMELPDRASRYVARVHRKSIGDRVVLFDAEARIEARAVIVEIRGASVFVEVGERVERNDEARRRITLIQAIGKSDKMDAIVRDATELGATRIVPVESARSIVKLGARAPARVERWRRIATEAARQSGRADSPVIGDVVALAVAAAEEKADVRVALVPNAERAASEVIFDEGSLALMVGPEGGLDAAEIAEAERLGWVAASIGPQVLRTETVAAAVLGALAVMAR